MSVEWRVVPSQPDEPGVREWLEDAGIAIPAEVGRFPTYDEIIEVLRSFGGLPVREEQLSESLYQLVLGKPKSEEFAQILGSVQKTGLFEFHFYGYSTDEFLMFKIVKKLTHVCGPLIIYETLAATPVAIDPSTDLVEAFKDWNLRFRERISYKNESSA